MEKTNSRVEYWNAVAGKKTFTHPLNQDLFKDFLPVSASILDVGCGYGRLCNQLENIGYQNIIGIDISKEMVRQGIERFPGLDLRCINLVENTSFQDESFDAIIMFAVLTCCFSDEEQQDLINSVFRVLKPGGFIYMSDYFLQENHRNITRYNAYHEKYGLYGVFELEDGAVLRHQAKPWIKTLLAPFQMLVLDEIPAETMNGHKSMIFQYWGQKKKKEKE